MPFDANSAIALIRIFAPLVVSILAAVGVSADLDTVTTMAIIVFGGVVGIYTGWKNNSLTKSAKEADEFMHQLKDGLFDHDDCRDWE